MAIVDLARAARAHDGVARGLGPAPFVLILDVEDGLERLLTDPVAARHIATIARARGGNALLVLCVTTAPPLPKGLEDLLTRIPSDEFWPAALAPPAPAKPADDASAGRPPVVDPDAVRKVARRAHSLGVLHAPWWRRRSREERVQSLEALAACYRELAATIGGATRLYLLLPELHGVSQETVEQLPPLLLALAATERAGAVDPACWPADRGPMPAKAFAAVANAATGRLRRHLAYRTVLGRCVVCGAEQSNTVENGPHPAGDERPKES